MAYEFKDDTFSLFENDKKGNDKAPDFKGRGKVFGTEVKIAVWKRKSQSGVEYWAGSIEEVAQPDMPQAEPEKAEPQPEAIGDEIPFNVDR